MVILNRNKQECSTIPLSLCIDLQTVLKVKVSFYIFCPKLLFLPLPSLICHELLFPRRDVRSSPPNPLSILYFASSFTLLHSCFVFCHYSVPKCFVPFKATLRLEGRKSPPNSTTQGNWLSFSLEEDWLGGVEV